MRRVPGSIPSPPAECGSCGRPFEKGERIVNVLIEREDGRWERLSFCAACDARGPSVRPLCRWVSEYAPKPRPKKIPPEMAEELMRSLLEKADWAAAANLFAWHLVRKRVLRHLSTARRDGVDYNLFEGKDGTRFEVPFIEPGDEDRRRFFGLLESIEEG